MFPAGAVNSCEVQNKPWAQSEIGALIALDASDSPDGKNAYDGFYHGVNVCELAKTYEKQFAHASSEDSAKAIRMTKALVGLRRFARTQPSDAQPQIDTMAETLFASLQVFLKKRTLSFKMHDFGGKPGLIEEEVAQIVKDIAAGSVSARLISWDGYWQRVFAECAADLFKTSSPCPFRTLASQELAPQQ